MLKFQENRNQNSWRFFKSCWLCGIQIIPEAKTNITRYLTVSKWGDSKIQWWKDLKTSGFLDVEVRREQDEKKTKGFFQVQKLPALWNSDHAALTLPKICFLENFSEYPPSPPKATDLPYLKRGDKFLENLILSEWKLQPPPKIGGKHSKKKQKYFPHSKKHAVCWLFGSFSIYVDMWLIALPYC